MLILIRKVLKVLQPNTNAGNAYEVSIYNREVRAAVKDNESHIFFGDHWADLQFQDVNARTENEARELISMRYPPELGFVVEDLTMI